MKTNHLVALLLAWLSITLCTSCTHTKSRTVRCQADMEGARIGVVAGSVLDILVTENYDEKQILRYNLGPDMLMALETGKVDVVVNGALCWPMVEQAYPHFGYFEFEGGEQSDVSIGVSKKNPELHRQLDAFVDSLMTAGEMDALLAKWGSKEGVLGNVEMARSHGTGTPIRVATPADYPPFMFVYKGQIVLTYSEKTSQTQLTFNHLPNVDKNLLERKDTELAAAIIRNSSKSVAIEETRIVVEVL